MRCFKGMLVVGAGTGAMFAAGAAMADTNVDNAALQQEIDALRAEVAQLKGDSWLTDQRADEIKGLVNDVLADADTRASLLQGGMNAGYDDGFFIGDTGGNFNLKLNGFLQFRFIYNNLDSGDSDGGEDENRWGFENTRTRLRFSGNVFNPNWGYYVQGNFASDGGSFKLNDAWISHNCGNGWKVYFGQFKLPNAREWGVDEFHQLAVERSLAVHQYHPASRSQGIKLAYTGEQFRFAAAITDGTMEQNTAWSNYDTEFSISARGEYLFSGAWVQFDDFTSPPGSEQAIMAGLGAHYQVDEYGTSADDEEEITAVTGDISFEFDGANIFGAFYYQNWEAGSSDADELGFVVQGGLYFDDKWEVFARYEYWDYDWSDWEELGLLTIGVNHYFNSNVKWTTDIVYGLDQIEDGWNGVPSKTGLREDASDEDGQLAFRTQMQLTF